MKGATIIIAAVRLIGAISIHAPVKGATVPAGSLASADRYFNPRSREGSDLHQVGRLVPGHRISIHAPVKGVTITGTISRSVVAISIHAPVKGATYDDVTPDDELIISIHAPVKGATRTGRSSPLSDRFQSTLP